MLASAQMKRGARTNIQIRGAPSALLDKLRARATRTGKTMSQYAIEVLERDLSRPSLEEWLDRVRSQPRRGAGGMSSAQAVREAREERAEQLARDAEERAKRHQR